MLDRDPDKFIPRFREEHVSEGGRAYGIKKVPQTAMFEITGEGAGDLPAALKGRFTSTGRAERSLKAYLNSQRVQLEAAKVKLAREAAEAAIEPDVDVFEEPVKPPVAVAATQKAEEVKEDKKPDTKTGSKVPVTAKTGTKSD
jgi:hypothetical protein